MKTRMNPQQVRRAILDKASASEIDLNRPENAFVVAKFTVQYRQGPLLNMFSDHFKAEKYALELHTGNTDFYAMSANPQDGLQMVADGKLVFIDEGTSPRVA